MKLKPCPFCGGGVNLVYMPTRETTYFSDRYCVLCEYTGDKEGCGAAGQINKDKALAIKAWNTRTKARE